MPTTDLTLGLPEPGIFTFRIHEQLPANVLVICSAEGLTLIFFRHPDRMEWEVAPACTITRDGSLADIYSAVRRAVRRAIDESNEPLNV